MNSFLEEICMYKKKTLKKIKFEGLNKFEPIDFKKAINKKNGISIIAEMKKASPSKGIIRQNYHVEKIAEEFEKGGASAISVLTEEKYFKGNIYYIPEVKKKSRLPVLRKDFIIDPYQIQESKYYGADAVLLIAAILDKTQLKDFVSLSNELKLTPLVEVHNEKELEKVLQIPIDVVGINNRNLDTFEIDLQTTIRLRKLIPSDKIVVSESGIKDTQYLKKLKEIGVNAALVGELLMESKDIVKTLTTIIAEANA